MKKENIVDMVTYREQQNIPAVADSAISDELEKAIQNLIHRLRELGPIQPN